MSSHVIWFDDKESTTFDYLVRHAWEVDISYEDEIEFEQHVKDTLGATLIRDIDDDDFYQWIGVSFENEQDMIVFILKAGNV